MLSRQRNPASWQLILADLALILFLVTAAALTGAGAQPAAPAIDAPAVDRAADARDVPPDPQPPQLAAAQSLYRPGPGLPGIVEWLEEQPRDPRAALTIVAEHAPGKAEPAWTLAREMAAGAAAAGVRARVIIREGRADDVHASLAYDQPME